jgi:hypothetical protein
MRTCGGAWSAVTISEMKFEVMPMMVMREMACMARTTVKVAPRAPKFWDAIMIGVLMGGRIGSCGIAWTEGAWTGGASDGGT